MLRRDDDLRLLVVFRLSRVSLSLRRRHPRSSGETTPDFWTRETRGSLP